jgi:hypothetical protein
LAFATAVVLAADDDWGVGAAKTAPLAANIAASTHAEMTLFIVINPVMSHTKRDPSRADGIRQRSRAFSRVRLLIRCGSLPMWGGAANS